MKTSGHTTAEKMGVIKQVNDIWLSEAGGRNAHGKKTLSQSCREADIQVMTYKTYCKQLAQTEVGQS